MDSEPSRVWLKDSSCWLEFFAREARDLSCAMAVPVRLGPLQRSAPFGTPLTRNKDRPGLDSLLPERYHAWKSASPEPSREGARAAKREKVQSLYDQSHLVASREILQSKILQQSQGISMRTKEEDEPLQSDLIREWRLAEKQRAELNAERYWKSKFLQWQRDHLAKINTDMYTEKIAVVQKELDTYEQENRTLGARQSQLEKETEQALDDFEAEEARGSRLEAEMQEAFDARLMWVRKALGHLEKRHRLEKEQFELLDKIVICCRHAELLGIPAGKMKGIAGFVERRQELAALKIQALQRGRLARKRVAALREQREAGEAGEAEYDATFDEDEDDE